ncbi:MAG: peptidase, partial [Neobacillus sp.]|nr:peptidase [Neobacillus sp.]
MNRKWLALLLTGSLLTGAGGTYVGLKWLGNTKGNSVLEQSISDKESANSEVSDSVDLEKVNLAYDLIVDRYVEKVDREKLIEGAIQGMLTVLDDPYSVYMDKET